MVILVWPGMRLEGEGYLVWVFCKRWSRTALVEEEEAIIEIISFDISFFIFELRRMAGDDCL